MEVNFVTPANALMFQRAWQNREIRTVGCAPALISVKKWCGPRLRRIRNPSLLPYMAPHVLASTAEQQLRPNLPAVRDVAVHVGGVSDWTTMHDEGLAPPSLPLPPSWSATSDLDIALAGEAARWLLKDESSWMLFLLGRHRCEKWFLLIRGSYITQRLRLYVIGLEGPMPTSRVTGRPLREHSESLRKIWDISEERVVSRLVRRAACRAMR
eukprot:s1019_g12.t1